MYAIFTRPTASRIEKLDSLLFLAPFLLSLLFCADAEEDAGAFFDFDGELVLLGAGLLLLDRLRVVIGIALDGTPVLLLVAP